MAVKSVLVVEDDPATRMRLATLVSAAPDLSLLAAAESLAQARQALRAGRPDVLLTDLGLPDGSGIDLIAEFAAAVPGAEIAVLTVFADEGHVLRAIEAGATGYLLKDGDDADVLAAIRQLIAGGSPISPSIARHVLRRLAPGARRSPEVVNPVPAPGDKALLTERETAVLQQIAKGFSYDEIASALGISVHTVTTHIKNIYRKLAVRSRGEAVFEAMQLGLIRVEPQA
ncbi:MAG: response regulator transcription factor [Burkholderiaceae bacterium]